MRSFAFSSRLFSFLNISLTASLISGCNQDFQLGNAIPTASDGSALPTSPDPTTPGIGNSGEEPPGDGEIITVSDSHSFTVEERAIDVLFVVDNSGSMSGEQTILTQSFDGFIQAFTQRYINARIGVTSTDMTGSSGVNYSNTSAYNGFIQKGPGGLIAKIEGNNASTTPRYLDTETMSVTEMVNRFRNNAFLGTNGSGSENGIGALAAFFSANLNGATGWNSGFLRGAQVPLHAIIVTDEDVSVTTEQSLIAGSSSNHYLRKYPTAQQNYYDRMMGIFNAAKPQGKLKIHTVAGDSENPNVANCGLMTQHNMLATGDAYKPYVQATGGTFIDICQGPFHQALINLGEDIAVSVQRDFALSKIPRNSNLIRVFVNNFELYQNHSLGFVYLPQENKIRISEGVDLDNLVQYNVRIEYPFEVLPQ